MDADFSVELGPPGEEATLEFPWSAGADGPRYLDLKRRPEMLAFVPEAAQYRELAAFLQSINSPDSAFETAKCDVWLTDELTESEQIYGAACKQCAYVDLVFAAERSEARLSFFRHEELSRRLAELLKKAPDIPAAVEIIVRRCYYHWAVLSKEPVSGADAEIFAACPDLSGAVESDVRTGFYWTLYLFGYGKDEQQARQRWGAALRFVTDAILQLSRADM